MRFVTEEFLAALGRAADQVKAGNALPADAGIVDVRVDRDKPHFDIDLISDAQAGLRPVNGTAAQSAAELSAEFGNRLRELRQHFERDRADAKPNRPASLLVNCGDLIVGRTDGLAPELRRVETSYADVWLPAVNGLRLGNGADPQADAAVRPYRDVLTVPGNEDAYSGGGTTRGGGRGRHPYYDQFATWLADGEIPVQPEKHPVAAVFRALPAATDGAATGLRDEPFGFVVVIGFDSNDIQYAHPLARDHGQIAEEQFDWSRRLVNELRTGVASNSPLYVIVATHHHLVPAESHTVPAAVGGDDEDAAGFRRRQQGGDAGAPACDPLAPFCLTNHLLVENTSGVTSNAFGFLLHCQEIGASLVLHGDTGQRLATTVVNTPLVAGQQPVQLTLVSAPAFAPGKPTSGMASISLDLWKGDAEIAFSYDLAPDEGAAGKPIQVTRPLQSASRIKASERRLYGKVAGLIAHALGDEVVKDKGKVQQFARYAEKYWTEHGYTPLSYADGTLPDLGVHTRLNRYYLLLLLREIGDEGNYEILLSRHNPLQPSAVGEWDTLLMPAFTSVRNLMDRLHLDVVRQVVQAEDVERARSAKDFDDAVERIQGSLGNAQEDLWLDEMREIGAELRRVKISPTTGELTEYEYHLVVLTPFVRTADKLTSDEKALVKWLEELPSLQLRGTAPADRSLPMESVMSGGRGLRWEPLAEQDDSVLAERKRVELPPGSVWFPLPARGQLGLWQDVPSVVARNADVMTWVDQQLADPTRRDKEGVFPPYLVLGKMGGTEGYDLKEGPFPFEPTAGGPGSAAGLATSTIEAMRRIEYVKTSDLAGKHPYVGGEVNVKRVVLVRRDVPRKGGARSVIAVFDAAEHHKAGAAGLSHFETCPVDREHGLLGLLRPTQRYVLEGGLDRAEWVTDFLAEHCADDPWGFLRATYGGAGEQVAVTPPLVEQVCWADWDSDDETLVEFLVCDGNHRVVHRVWNQGRATAAIGVTGEPNEPYYARPFSAYHWDVTAEEPIAVTPQARYKYSPRVVDPDKMPGLSPTARDALKRIAPGDRYRRYYRDLNTGFGSVGGQGGRW